MAIRKKAILSEVTEFTTRDSEGSMVRTAAANLSLESNSEASRIIQAEMAKHSTALFFKAKAIAADEVNSNGDYFSWQELLKSYQTFRGVPFFTNHNNQDVENARGKIVWSELNPNDKAIYVVGYVDAEAYPHICRGIKEDYMSGVSMGAVHEDALILMFDGTEKPIRDIQSGEKVITAEGNIQPVSLVNNEYLGKPMYSVSVKTYHRTPIFTEDHPVWIIDGADIHASKLKHDRVSSVTRRLVNWDKEVSREEFISDNSWRNIDYQPIYRDASKLSVNDHLLIPSRFNLCDGESLKKDFYYLVGAFLGDGYVKLDKRGQAEGIAFCIGSNEIELASRIKSIVEKISDYKPSTFHAEERNGLYISYYDRKLANWFLENTGSGAKSKRIKFPLDLKEDAQALLAGIIDTDGCIVDKTNQKAVRGSKFGGFQISSANIKMLEDFQSILIALGAVSRISTMERTPSVNSLVKIPTTEHTLAIGSNASKHFSGSIKYAQSGFTAAEIPAGQSFITNISSRNYMACPVDEVTAIENYNRPVYDLRVEGDMSYVADGVGVHNCSVDYSVCSICNNKAASVDEYCTHIKNRKGRKFSGTSKNVQTGEIQTFRDAAVYEENYGIRFIELSGVADPACRSCRIQGVYDQSSDMERAASVLNRVANIQNSLYLYKSSDLLKESSQENITALETAIQSLENVCTDLIKNRKQVEMDFAADGVNILSEFQTWLDELVGAGYGQLNAAPGGIPGVDDAQGAAPAPAEASPTPASPPIAGGTQPVSLGASAPGSISGNPMAPAVNSPAMPTAPVRPMASNDPNLTKIAETIAQIKAVLSGDDQMQRRLPNVAAKEKQDVMETLSTSWKEKQLNPENKQITNADLSKGGGNMTTVNASRTESPESITEKQLDQSGGYHPRENKERNETTQKQLDGVRKNDEKTVVSEGQLRDKRELNTPTVVTQKQLEGERKNDEKTSITQVQLEGERKNDEKEVVTEKQLDGMSGTGEFKGTSKSASEVVASVIKVLATAVLNEEASADLAQSIIAKQTDGLKAKNQLLNSITDSTEATVNASSAKTASDRKSAYLTAAIVNGLKTLVATDKSINPEDVVYVLEAVSEQKEVSVARIAESVQSIVKEASAVSATASKKSEILTALAGKLPAGLQAWKDKKDGKSEEKDNDKKEEKGEEKEKAEKDARIAERQQFKKLATDSSKLVPHRIETDFEETGLTNEILANETESKKMILAFIKGVSAVQGKKLAGITNVTVDGEKVHIAIQWDENEGSVDLDMPAGDTPDLSPEAPAPEGDVTGEGMDALTAPEPALGAPAAGAPTPAPAGSPAPAGMPAPMAASKNSLTKEAQANMGGQVPGSPGAGAAGQTPQPAPGDEAPMPALTGDAEEDEGVGETDRPGQFPAGAVCHFCGAKDVDIGKEGRGPGVSECNNCGAVWETLVTINVLNPEDIEFKGDKEAKVEEPEDPELPSMPVAAQASLTVKGLHKVAELEKQHGHVCPGCGQTECKPIKQTAGMVEYICPGCETKTVKELFVDPANPKAAVHRVSWNMDPKKLTGNCPSCKESAQKFAARMKVAKMMKAASKNEFPRANCLERLARQYGINAVSTFGPCKGKPLAECVCKELEALGFNSVRKMNKLAAVYMQEDPMAECLKDQLCKGYKQATAQQICNTLKKVYASEADKNILLLAWGDEPGLNNFDLEEMDSKLHGGEGAEGAVEAPVAPEAPTMEVSDDIGSPLDEVKETVSIEIPKEIAEDLKEQLEVKTEAPAEEVAIDKDSTAVAPEVDVAPEVVEGAPADGVASDLEVSQPVMASTQGKTTMQKQAKSPTMVEHIETEVKAGVPRKNETLGNESKENINVSLASPSIPRKDQTLGNEGKDNINVALKEVDVPTASAYLGGEAEAQKGLPENTVKSKGTVIAEQAKTITKEAKTPTMVEHVEDKVTSGVPRKNETLGNEGKDNIDVAMNSPEIPRKDQTLGNEGKDNINVSTKEVDVPTGGGFLGGEAEAQKGLPENSVMSKGTVIAESDKRIQHEAKLKEARREKARMVAAKLLGKGIITEAEFEQTVEDLAWLPLNRIEAHASKLFGATQVKTSSAQAPGLTAAVVVESKAPEAPQTVNKVQQLSGLFTIGNQALSKDQGR